MTKHKLELDYNYNFELIGICCHQKDYRLCWAINGALSIHLEKSKENLAVVNRGKTMSFPYFYCVDEENFIDYQLIKNNISNGFLIQEKQEIDYFLMIHNNHVIEINTILTQLKKVDLILTSFLIEVDTLKSKELLIF